MERASHICAKLSPKIYGENRKLRIIFDEMKGFNYNQTKVYLEYLRGRKHTDWYWNNKRSIDWNVVDPRAIEPKQPKNEPALMIADWLASAIFAAIDEDKFGKVHPEFIQIIAPKILKIDGIRKTNGFCLLPEAFAAPLTPDQKRSLKFVGYG